MVAALLSLFHILSSHTCSLARSLTHTHTHTHTHTCMHAQLAVPSLTQASSIHGGGIHISTVSLSEPANCTSSSNSSLGSGAASASGSSIPHHHHHLHHLQGVSSGGDIMATGASQLLKQSASFTSKSSLSSSPGTKVNEWC